jgi:hypothetical protein
VLHKFLLILARVLLPRYLASARHLLTLDQRDPIRMRSHRRLRFAHSYPPWSGRLKPASGDRFVATVRRRISRVGFATKSLCTRRAHALRSCLALVRYSSYCSSYADRWHWTQKSFSCSLKLKSVAARQTSPDNASKFPQLHPPSEGNSARTRTFAKTDGHSTSNPKGTRAFRG